MGEPGGMTAERPSIFVALSRRLSEIRHDFLYRKGVEPRIVFKIGTKTYHDMCNEDEMRRLYMFGCAVTFKAIDPTPPEALPKDTINLDGAYGRVVDGLNGFLIQILNA